MLKAWSDDPVTERVLAEVERARGRAADADGLLNKAQAELAR